eukprot:365982-Chlamydomonas_euryale.AAC.5
MQPLYNLQGGQPGGRHVGGRTVKCGRHVGRHTVKCGPDAVKSPSCVGKALKGSMAWGGWCGSREVCRAGAPKRFGATNEPSAPIQAAGTPYNRTRHESQGAMRLRAATPTVRNSAGAPRRTSTSQYALAQALRTSTTHKHSRSDTAIWGHHLRIECPKRSANQALQEGAVGAPRPTHVRTGTATSLRKVQHGQVRTG